MSIQRYTNEPFGAFVKCENGDYVLFTDHLAELHNLLSTLAGIRTALGVDEKPMLSELAGEIGKLKAERDANRLAGIRAAKRAYKAMMVWRGLARVYRKNCDAAVRERDAAVEALRGIRRIARAELAKTEGERG